MQRLSPYGRLHRAVNDIMSFDVSNDFAPLPCWRRDAVASSARASGPPAKLVRTRSAPRAAAAC